MEDMEKGAPRFLDISEFGVRFENLAWACSNILKHTTWRHGSSICRVRALMSVKAGFLWVYLGIRIRSTKGM